LHVEGLIFQTSPRPKMRLDPGVTVMIQLSLQPILALVAGILILVQPRLLNYIVAIYLIVIGVLGLVGGV
jgi:threonine/homoserine efflux transporter RhtA